MTAGLDPLTRVGGGSSSLSMYIDVTSAAYGALGNGTADDTVAIQAAIDAAAAMSGATVYLPHGTYRITASLKFYGTSHNGVSLIGGDYGVFISNTKIVWHGATGGYMIDVINCSGCYFANFFLETDDGGNVAYRGINIDQEQTLADVGSITTGTNALSGNGFFRASMIGRAITVVGAGPGGTNLVTTVSGFTDFNHITLTANASTTVVNANITITSPYATGSTTGVTVERMTFRNNVNNANLIMVSVAYYSWANCELMKIRDCKFYQDYQSGTATNASRGTAVSLGNVIGGGGGNNYNQVVTGCEFTGYSYDINFFNAIALVRDCEFQYATINLTGSGTLEIIHNRPENSRQFIKFTNGHFHIQFNETALLGTWDAAYPTIEFTGATGHATLLNNTWNDDGGNTILAVKNTTSANDFRLISKGNHYPNTQHVLGGKTFNSFRFWTTELDDPSPRIQTGNGGDYDSMPIIAGELTQFIYLSGVPTVNGATIYIKDGTPGSNPAAGSGPGSFADYVNGVWICRPVKLSQYGAAVASAATITATGEVFHVTGTTNITSVSGTGIKAGQKITIIFDGILTFTDGSNLKLAGNFVTAADSTITLCYDGSNWFERCRSIN